MLRFLSLQSGAQARAMVPILGFILRINGTAHTTKPTALVMEES